jgi:hypothetical protein
MFGASSCARRAPAPSIAFRSPRARKIVNEKEAFRKVFEQGRLKLETACVLRSGYYPTVRPAAAGSAICHVTSAKGEKLDFSFLSRPGNKLYDALTGVMWTWKPNGSGISAHADVYPDYVLDISLSWQPVGAWLGRACSVESPYGSGIFTSGYCTFAWGPCTIRGVIN